MEHQQTQQRQKEYSQWILEMKNDGPWKGKKPTPAEKVQGVTHPIGEEIAGQAMEEFLKTNGGKMGSWLGHGLGKTGLILDVLTNRKDAW